MSTRISSLSIRTTVPSTTSPCLKLLMSESCSARSSSIVVGSGPRSRGAGATGASGSLRPRRPTARRPCRRRRARVAAASWPLRRRPRRRRRRSRTSGSVVGGPRLARRVGAVAPRRSTASAAWLLRRSLPRRRAGSAAPRRRPASASRRCRVGRRPAPRPASAAAGASATAVAAAARSGIWSASEAAASGWTAPSCCSSVNGLVSPVGQVPRHDNGLGSAQAGPETIRGGPW